MDKRCIHELSDTFIELFQRYHNSSYYKGEWCVMFDCKYDKQKQHCFTVKIKNRKMNSWFCITPDDEEQFSTIKIQVRTDGRWMTKDEFADAVYSYRF